MDLHVREVAMEVDTKAEGEISAEGTMVVGVVRHGAMGEEWVLEEVTTVLSLLEN